MKEQNNIIILQIHWDEEKNKLSINTQIQKKQTIANNFSQKPSHFLINVLDQRIKHNEGF